MVEFTVFIYARGYLPRPVNVLDDTNEMPKKILVPISLMLDWFNLLLFTFEASTALIRAFPQIPNPTNTNPDF